MAISLRRESAPGDPVPSYTVFEDGEQVGRVYRQEENGEWHTEPDVGTFDNRESAVHEVARGT